MRCSRWYLVWCGTCSKYLCCRFFITDSEEPENQREVRSSLEKTETCNMWLIPVTCWWKQMRNSPLIVAVIVPLNQVFLIEDGCCQLKIMTFFMYKGEWQGITHYFTAHQKKRKDEYGQRHFIIGWSIWLMHTLYFAHLCYLQLVWSQESLSGVLLKESKVHCC